MILTLIESRYSFITHYLFVPLTFPPVNEHIPSFDFIDIFSSKEKVINWKILGLSSITSSEISIYALFIVLKLTAKCKEFLYSFITHLENFTISIQYTCTCIAFSHCCMAALIAILVAMLNLNIARVLKTYSVLFSDGNDVLSTKRNRNKTDSAPFTRESTSKR